MSRTVLKVLAVGLATVTYGCAGEGIGDAGSTPDASVSGGSGGKGSGDGSGGKKTGSAGAKQGAGGAKTGGGGAKSGGGGSSTEPDGTGGSPTPIDPTAKPGDCGLDSPAFCETFETPSPGGRGVDIDDSRWSFSRWGHQVQYFWERIPASTHTDRLFPASFCGAPFENLGPGKDVKSCDGVGIDGKTSHQLNEVFDDQGDFGFNSMRVRQPFDFTGRTGKLVWDVDAKVNPLSQGHGWWFEVWITEDPVPLPYHEAPTVASYPRKGVGFAFQFGADCDTVPPQKPDWVNALETVHVTDNYNIIHQYPFWELDVPQNRGDCFKVKDTKMNHFELRISKDQAELWASDYDDPQNLKLRDTVHNLDLTFERGYVHFQHAHYNAPKDGTIECYQGDHTQCPTPSQTFRWDNIGFDGPTYPLARSYDVPDHMAPGAGTGILLGWFLKDGHTETFTVNDVDLTDATDAYFNFTLMAAGGQHLEYTLNDNAPHVYEIAGTPGHESTGVRGHSVPIPLSELKAGTNTIAVRITDTHNDEGIGNLDLTVNVAK